MEQHQCSMTRREFESIEEQFTLRMTCGTSVRLPHRNVTIEELAEGRACAAAELGLA